jgi:hypothetical protein
MFPPIASAMSADRGGDGSTKLEIAFWAQSTTVNFVNETQIAVHRERLHVVRMW